MKALLYLPAFKVGVEQVATSSFDIDIDKLSEFAKPCISKVPRCSQERHSAHDLWPIGVQPLFGRPKSTTLPTTFSSIAHLAFKRGLLHAKGDMQSGISTVEGVIRGLEQGEEKIAGTSYMLNECSGRSGSRIKRGENFCGKLWRM